LGRPPTPPGFAGPHEKTQPSIGLSYPKTYAAPRRIEKAEAVCRARKLARKKAHAKI
jgi:hypothetical protein